LLSLLEKEKRRATTCHFLSKGSLAKPGGAGVSATALGRRVQEHGRHRCRRQGIPEGFESRKLTFDYSP